MTFTTEEILKAAAEGAAKYEAEQFEVLKKFCSIDCGSRDEEGNAKIVEIVDGLLKEIKGIDIQHHYFEGYGINIVARLKPENPDGKIVLNAHLDTVFHRGDTEKYPFRLDYENDMAYGLGIVDCKGGVLVAIYAVRAMQEAGMLPNKEIVFIFNCDEEIGSPTGHQVFDMEIPGLDAAYVFEPSRLVNGVLTARKGACSITVNVKGKKAHSGINYLEGRSATVELAYTIMKLYESNINERGIQFNVAKLYGGEDGTGVVADKASAAVGVRVANQADIDTVKEIVARVEKDIYIDGCEKTVTIDRIGVPMERNEKNIGLYKTVWEAGKLLGYDLIEQQTGGGGDVSWFSYKGVPSVDALSPYMYKIHSYDEHMRLSSVKEKTELFCVVLGTMK